MPIIKSAIKRVRQQKTRTVRNSARKRLSKETLKQFMELIAAGKIAEAAKLFPKLQKSIDLLVKNNLWHKNKAARQKSSLSKLIKDAPAVKKAKPAAKAAPKATAKKPAAKKAPVKTAAKKK